MMRKIILIVLAGLLACQVKAQDEREAGDVRFGLQAGYSVFNLKGNGVGEFSTNGAPALIKGFSVGANAVVRLSRFFVLRHEVSITQKGGLLKLEGEDKETFDSKYKNMYLDIAPVSLGFHVEGIQLFTGPFISVLMNSSIQRKDENGQLYTDKSIYGIAGSEGNYSQKVDAGWLAGLGYEFKNGLTLGGRYVYGMTPVIEHTERKDGQWKIYNRGFVFTLGYVLPY